MTFYLFVKYHKTKAINHIRGLWSNRSELKSIECSNIVQSAFIDMLWLYFTEVEINWSLLILFLIRPIILKQLRKEFTLQKMLISSKYSPTLLNFSYYYVITS